MTADDTTHRSAAGAIPEQTLGRAAGSPAQRFVQQVHGIDAWIAARREREQALLAPSLNRDQRMSAAREIESLRRTHDTIKGRCARRLADDELGPFRSLVATAVIAHRHAWFVDKLALLLTQGGVTVLTCTDNGAEALGVVVAEQPDLLLVGDRLAMTTGAVLLTEAGRFSAGTLRATQASDEQEAGTLRAASHAVFLRHQPPAMVADALVALLQPAPARLDGSDGLGELDRTA